MAATSLLPGSACKEQHGGGTSNLCNPMQVHMVLHVTSASLDHAASERRPSIDLLATPPGRTLAAAADEHITALQASLCSNNTCVTYSCSSATSFYFCNH